MGLYFLPNAGYTYVNCYQVLYLGCLQTTILTSLLLLPLASLKTEPTNQLTMNYLCFGAFICDHDGTEMLDGQIQSLFWTLLNMINCMVLGEFKFVKSKNPVICSLFPKSSEIFIGFQKPQLRNDTSFEDKCESCLSAHSPTSQPSQLTHCLLFPFVCSASHTAVFNPGKCISTSMVIRQELGEGRWGAVLTGFQQSLLHTVQTAWSTSPMAQWCVLSHPDPKLVTWLLYFTHRSGHTWTIKICLWFKVKVVKLRILSSIYYELKWFCSSAWISQEFFLYKLNSWMSVSEMKSR